MLSFEMIAAQHSKDQVAAMAEKDHYRFGLSKRGKNVNDNNTLADDLRARIAELEVERDTIAAMCHSKLQSRCAKLEAALRKIESNDMRYDLTACAQIARTALETGAKHMEGCRCPECDPDYNDPRGDANGS